MQLASRSLGHTLERIRPSGTSSMVYYSWSITPVYCLCSIAPALLLVLYSSGVFRVLSERRGGVRGDGGGERCHWPAIIDARSTSTVCDPCSGLPPPFVVASVRSKSRKTTYGFNASTIFATSSPSPRVKRHASQPRDDIIANITRSSASVPHLLCASGWSEGMRWCGGVTHSSAYARELRAGG